MKTSKLIVGVDTAKRVFHLYWVDPETGEEMNERLSRSKFLSEALRQSCGVSGSDGSVQWQPALGA